MNIGFDAKRAFHNSTGLGNYSRTLLCSLARFFPQHNYFLFNPSPSNSYSFTQKQFTEITPKKMLHKAASWYWRSYAMLNDILAHTQLYHGLSGELPFGIHNKKISSVVSIHDLVFEEYPRHYKPLDVFLYRKKYSYAARVAHKVIAISEATKRQLIERYNIDENKIKVCYQSCHERYYQKYSSEQIAQVKTLYAIDKPYLLSVGSIIERKNLLTVCKAFKQVRSKHDINLLVVGKGKGAYKEQIISYLVEQDLAQHVFFLEDMYPNVSNHLPELYVGAEMLLYPSLSEGFGIPVLEACAVGCPVITSNVSSLPEAGGEAAVLVQPQNVEHLAYAIFSVLEDSLLKYTLINKGYEQAEKFSQQATAQEVMKLYENLNG